MVVFYYHFVAGVSQVLVTKCIFTVQTFATDTLTTVKYIFLLYASKLIMHTAGDTCNPHKKKKNLTLGSWNAFTTIPYIIWKPNHGSVIKQFAPFNFWIFTYIHTCKWFGNIEQQNIFEQSDICMIFYHFELHVLQHQ